MTPLGGSTVYLLKSAWQMFMFCRCCHQGGRILKKGRDDDWLSGRNNKLNKDTSYQIILYYKNYSKVNLYSNKNNKQKYKYAVVYDAGIMAGLNSISLDTERRQHFTRITSKCRLTDQATFLAKLRSRATFA